MFELKTHLEKPQRLIELEFGSNLAAAYKNFRENLYVDIDDTENLMNVINYRKFSFRYHPMKIEIKYKGEYIVDFDKPSAAGGGLWLDYLTCIEKYIENKQVTTPYGIDYFMMGMESLNNKELKFFIMLEHNKELIISVNLPENGVYPSSSQ